MERHMNTFIGRESIYNRLGHKVAYECLYKKTKDINQCHTQQSNDSDISAQLISACNKIGFDQILGKKVGFFNVTMEMVRNIEAYDLPIGSVLELIPFQTMDEQDQMTLKAVKKKGFKIALDDFLFNHQNSPYLSSADVVKVDYSDCSKDEIKEMVKELRKRSRILLAEKVETENDYKHALEMGFDLFQGFYFDVPEMIVV